MCRAARCVENLKYHLVTQEAAHLFPKLHPSHSVFQSVLSKHRLHPCLQVRIPAQLPPTRGNLGKLVSLSEPHL